MKRAFYILLLLIFSNTLFADPNTAQLDKLRTEYLIALSDYLNAPKVYESFLKVENPSAQILAYPGALEAIMTKTTWNVFKKISYLNKSEESFKKAIKLAPNDVEIRFMRLAVQYEIPEDLGFSKEMESDKKFIIQNIKSFNSLSIPLSLRKQILGFTHRSKMFTPIEIEKFKLTLALN